MTTYVPDTSDSDHGVLSDVSISSRSGSSELLSDEGWSLVGNGDSATEHPSDSSHTPRTSISTLQGQSFDMTPLSGSTIKDTKAGGRQNSAVGSSKIGGRLVGIASNASKTGSFTSFVTTNKLIVASVALFVLGTLLKLGSPIYDDYVWKQRIASKSVAASEIPANDEYIRIYKATCDKSKDELDAKLSECIAQSRSNNEVTLCYRDYSQGLAQDAEFCGYDVDKLESDALYEQTKDSLIVLAGGIERRLDSLVKHQYALWQTQIAKLSTGLNLAREQVREATWEWDSRLLYRVGQVRDHWDALSDQAKYHALKIKNKSAEYTASASANARRIVSETKKLSLQVASWSNDHLLIAREKAVQSWEVIDGKAAVFGKRAKIWGESIRNHAKVAIGEMEERTKEFRGHIAAKVSEFSDRLAQWVDQGRHGALL